MNIEWVYQTLGDMAAVVTAPGSLELLLLTASAIWPAKRKELRPGAVARIAVVVPAHNEAESIGACVDSLMACEPIEPAARIFVVADNCTDQTAAIARRHGAEVIERFDGERRGKGHALEYAFAQLLPMGFDGFLIVDADSRVEPNLERECATAFARGAQAVQAPYLVLNPGESRSTRLLGLALRAFNYVRPRGRSRLGLSAGILGNGFGLRRETLEKAPYTSHSIVEDLEYHLELMRVGVRVELLELTRVYGAMPTAGTGRATQRARWEGGRLRILRERAGWLLAQLSRGRLRFAEVLLDLLLLPLAFHTVLLLVAFAGSAPSQLAALAGFLILAAHLGVTIASGRTRWADFKTLASVPVYLVWKVLQLPRIVATSRRDAAWIRTARTEEVA